MSTSTIGTFLTPIDTELLTYPLTTVSLSAELPYPWTTTITFITTQTSYVLGPSSGPGESPHPSSHSVAATATSSANGQTVDSTVSHGTRYSPGVVAGVAIACLIGGALLAFLATFVILRRRYRRKAAREMDKGAWVAELVQESARQDEERSNAARKEALGVGAEGNE